MQNTNMPHVRLLALLYLFGVTAGILWPGTVSVTQYEWKKKKKKIIALLVVT